MARKSNPTLKDAHAETEYTHSQIIELKKCASDPIYFIRNYVKIQHPMQGAILFDLYDYQEEMINLYQYNKYTVILSARQTGKMLPLDTKIATPDGWTTMGDIRVGDYVMGADGLPTEVTWISDIDTPQTAYKLHFDAGDPQIACSDHEWEVEQKYRKHPQVLTTQQMVDLGVIISDKNESRFKIKTCKPFNLPDSTLPIDPYTLGVWLGDGTSRTGEITTHIDDLEIYEYVDSQFDTYQRPDNTNTIRTTMYGLRTYLRESKLIQNKHIPIEYSRASYTQRLELLQGLMDTDGYVDPRTGQCEITLADKRLSNDVFHLASTLGLKCTYKERWVGKFIRYEVKFSAYSNQIKVFKLKRKLDNMKKDPHHSREFSTKKRSIQKIEKVDSIPMRCIGVDNVDKLYTFGDSCIPTHNSITSASYLLWFAMFHFDKTVLIASNKDSNAQEMILRIRYAYENLPMWIKPGVLEDGWNKHSIGFDNGSRIISTATSANSGRGLSISLLFLDEFAFVANAVAEEFWTSISPTLSTGGSCIMTSTPNGDTNIYSQIWRGANVGSNGFVPLHVSWDQAPGRGEKFKKEEIGKIGQRKWDQEYECEFLSSDALLLDSRYLVNLTHILDKLKPIYNIKDIMFWDDIKKGNTYLIGVDPATGNGEDYSAITVFHFPSLQQVAEYRSNTMSTNDLYTILKNLLIYMEKKETNIYFSIENNGVGEGIIALYQADEFPPEIAEFISESGKDRLGFYTTSRTKLKACINLKELMEKDKLSIKSQILLAELKAFVRRKGSYSAALGSTDDCVSAMLVIVRMLDEISTYETEAFNKLYANEYTQWSDQEWDGYTEGYDEDDMGLPMIM